VTGERWTGDGWTLVNGDCVEETAKLHDASVDLSVYSPPFISLYTYSNTERDMGNCANVDQFFAHFGFLIRELLRTTKPGRNTCVHVAQVPAMLERDGYIGMKDFRGKTIQAYEADGWVYHGEVCIDKDPQAQAIRTKSKSLLFVQMRKDSSWLRPALADYILVFRKPGDNLVPIQPDLSNEDWIQWARPIWYGIRESDVLQVAPARAEEDERHICPLQLGTIERCVRLWSNPGELVLSPFAGIGSEGYEAVRLGRRFLGFELKPSYAQIAARNLATASTLKDQSDLFEHAAGEASA
jgi:DNA modification methylase